MARKTAAQPNQFDFDVICIGSGSAGGSAAVLAARKGLRVALVEGNALGGESPSHSSIPIHACLQAVNSLAACRNAGESGIEIGRIHPSWEKVMAFKERCIKKTGVLESATAFEKAGIQLFQGFAQFADPWTIRIDRSYVTGRQIIIATGADDYLPNISNLDEIKHLTHREALELSELPSSVFIVGGGATGCSLAEIFHSLGSRVYLAEAASNLLPREDAEVGQVEAEILKNKGVHVFTNTEIKEVTPKANDQKEIVVLETGQKKNIVVDQLVIATGRRPRTDLNLPAAGVNFGGGIKVNRYLQTSTKHIYAAGDVLGHDMLTYLAAYHARVVIHNILYTKAKEKMALDYTAITRYIPLSPGVAATGLTEAELLSKQVPFKKAITPLHGLDRSYLSQQSAGFVKLLCSADKKHILGGSIIAPAAPEMIAHLALAVSARLSVETFRNSPKAFATWPEAFNLACQKFK